MRKKKIDVYEKKTGRPIIYPKPLIREIATATGYSRKKVSEILRACAWITWQHTVKGNMVVLPYLASVSAKREGVRNPGFVQHPDGPLVIRFRTNPQFRKYVKANGIGIVLEEETEQIDDESDEDQS